MHKNEDICNNITYAKELKNGYLQDFNYIVLYKNYLKEKNI